MKFKIGDRVIAIKPYGNNPKIVGKSGTICPEDTCHGHHTVKFDDPGVGWGFEGRKWHCLESVLEFDKIYQFNSLLDQYYGENKEI